jgi:hypothetical protein
MRARGWNAVDVVLVSGDAYIDHPGSAAALLTRGVVHVLGASEMPPAPSRTARPGELRGSRRSLHTLDCRLPGRSVCAGREPPESGLGSRLGVGLPEANARTAELRRVRLCEAARPDRVAQGPSSRLGRERGCGALSDRGMGCAATADTVPPWPRHLHRRQVRQTALPIPALARKSMNAWTTCRPGSGAKTPQLPWPNRTQGAHNEG